MRKIITLLVSVLIVPLSAISSQLDNYPTSPNELDCFDGEALFVDCMYGITEIKTFVSAERKIKNSGDVGHLKISYIVSQNTPFLDGIDPNMSIHLKFTYYINGLFTFSKMEKVGDFFSFDGMQRVSPGHYTFKGKIFSDEQGCMTEFHYLVNASEYTVSIRSHNFSPKKLKIEQEIKTC